MTRTAELKHVILVDDDVPVAMREVFERAQFADVELRDYEGLDGLG